ncbi:hypothetical protein HMPREF9412_2319 [Paenibacillus sp. HGF5]|nr:hypothetical protein HMPREF9412_2319 [Paenibacillus sp. HGF5]
MPPFPIGIAEIKKGKPSDSLKASACLSILVVRWVSSWVHPAKH